MDLLEEMVKTYSEPVLEVQRTESLLRFVNSFATFSIFLLFNGKECALFYTIFFCHFMCRTIQSLIHKNFHFDFFILTSSLAWPFH